MSKRDQEIARAMIEIASEYIGRDYDVRLGVSREESAQVLENWPPTDDTDETTNLVINNSMNEVCHAIRFPDGWPEHLLFSRDEAKDVFSLWLGKPLHPTPAHPESKIATEQGDIRIVTATGAVTFNNSFTVTASSQPAHLTTSKLALPHLAFNDVLLNLGASWAGRAFFYNSIILDFTFHTLLAATSTPFDLDLATASKDIHDQQMESLLGPPSTECQRSLSFCPDLTDAQATLSTPHFWKFT